MTDKMQWRMVPVEPTDEMLNNVYEEVGGHCYVCTKWLASADDCRRVYASMIEAAPSPGTAKQRYAEANGDEEPSALERLRFFCSLAMNGQDWLDVEPFFAALHHQEQAEKAWGVQIAPEMQAEADRLSREAVEQWDALKKDAERYRWLRDHFVDVLFGEDSGNPITVRGQRDFGDPIDGGKLDAAIDAAMGGGNG